MSASGNGTQSDGPDNTPEGRGKRYWLDDPGNVKKLFIALIVICVGFGAVDFFYHKHTVFEMEEFPVAYGIFGFVSFVFIVFAGKGLRRLIMRDEDYYDR